MAAAPKAPHDAHEWVSFEDPTEDRTWLVDVTFMLSRWCCIYGAGCQGSSPNRRRSDGGCCSYGAHFTDETDAARVQVAAGTLSGEQWQFRSKARRKSGVLKRDSKGAIATRLVDGACIFLNRPGHLGGAGCALHRAAIERGVPLLQLKPDVCWQLPLRREDSVAANGHVTSSLVNGGGGTGAKAARSSAGGARGTEAFSGRDPVYVSLEDELTAMIGRDVYGLLASYLRARQGRRVPLLVHPTVRERASGPVTGADLPGPAADHKRRRQSGHAFPLLLLSLSGSQSASSDGSHHPPPARPAPQIRKAPGGVFLLRVGPTLGHGSTVTSIARLNCAPLRNADDVPFSRAAPKISRIPPQSAAMR